jgi:CHAT domain-containing protein
MLYLMVPAPRAGALRGAPLLISAILAFGYPLQAGADSGGCGPRLSARVLSESQWRQGGSTVERRAMPAASQDHAQFVRVDENGVDVEVEFVDGAGAVLAQSDSPVERRVSQYVYLPAAAAGATLVVTAKDPAGLVGTVRVTWLAADLPDGPTGSVGCAAALRQWADADMDYARGHLVTLGRVPADAGGAHAAFESAGRAYAAALANLQAGEYPSERGQLELNLAALAYYGLKDWAGSARWGARAAATFAGTHETYRRARAQAIEAAAWIELATKSAAVSQTAVIPQAASTQFAAARSLLTTLAAFHAARHEEYDQALQINNIGLAYSYESRFEAAIPYYERAQRAFEHLRETTRAALALQNIAFCDWGLGRLTAALSKFDRAVELMSSTTRPNLYLIALNNSGLAHYAAGHFDESLRLQTQALDLATRIQSDQARERSDYGLGVTYYAIGDRELAAEFLGRGLEISTPELDARTRVAMLRALAQIKYETGHLAEAIRHDSEALRLASAPAARARILLRLAQDYAADGDAAGARDILDALLSHPSHHDDQVHAMALLQRGHLFRVEGSVQLAERDLTQGIQTLDQLDSLAERFDVRIELARVYADQGRTDQALTVLRQALKHSREIREQTANPEYRTSIVQSLRPALSLEVDLLRAKFTTLTGQGRIASAQNLARESLAVVDDNRAAGFQAWRAEYLEQHLDGDLARLLSSSAALYRDMAERRYQLAVREDRAGTEDPRARALREDIARLRVRLGLINSEVARRSGGLAGNTPSQGSNADASRIERTLAPGEAVVEYWLGTPHAYAWVVTQSGTDWIELPASEEIGRAARTLHEGMRGSWSASERRDACAQLYQLVFAPLRQALTGARDLTLVPDGPLHYAPFAALRDLTRSEAPYLIQSFVISVAPAMRFAPEATARGTAPEVPAASRMLIVADPIYAADDARLGAQHSGILLAHSVQNDRAVLRGISGRVALARLESSAREASQIRGLFGAEHVDLLEGADATREAVLGKDLARYRFIHIASHGLIDSEIPQLSALILGTQGSDGPVADPYLRAADFLTRTFHAQAIVLSACDTALGKEFGSEGLVGLRYAALARGAQAVVASLWPVADGIAATLMTKMYRGIIASDEAQAKRSRFGGHQVARALAVAMRGELERAPALDPALWAPFTVYVAGD